MADGAALIRLAWGSHRCHLRLAPVAPLDNTERKARPQRSLTAPSTCTSAGTAESHRDASQRLMVPNGGWHQSLLLAPASVYWEIGNAFSAMLKRKRITLEQAKAAVQVFHTIPIRWLDVDLEDALVLAARLDIDAYDAYIIAAAQKQKCSILTLDGGLIHAARVAKVPVLEVSP